MKLYAPAYYQNFKCIADRCEHSCCIGWEIDIDNDTACKYRALEKGYGAVIAESIVAGEVPHFRLDAAERCPHLDERGLCRIILNLGEDYLCDICREHPRFYNFTNVCEVGIGLSCPEAARVILSSPDFDRLEEIGEVDAEPDGVTFDGRAERGAVYALLQDGSRDYAAALDAICRTYGIDLADNDRCLAVLDSLEYLNPDHKALFLKYSSQRSPTDRSVDVYRKRFLAYLIYRHCTEALDLDDFCVRLAFCLFCERLLTSLICTEAAHDPCDVAALASVISEEIEYSDENTEAIYQI